MMEMFKMWPSRDEMLSHCFVLGLSGESVCPGSHESMLSLQSNKTLLDVGYSLSHTDQAAG